MIYFVQLNIIKIFINLLFLFLLIFSHKFLTVSQSHDTNCIIIISNYMHVYIDFFYIKFEIENLNFEL